MNNINITNEVWVNIYGYEGCYQVSNIGRVKSLGRIVSRGNNFITINESIMTLKEKNSKKGKYYYISLSKEGHNKNFKVCDLVIESFIPKPNYKYKVLHKNNILTDNSLDNLLYFDMNFKKCFSCNNIKNTIDFTKIIGTDRFKSRCIVCQKKYNSELRTKNKDRETINKKEYYINNKEHILKRSKNWYEKNKDRKVRVAKEWNNKNIIELRKKKLIYRKNKRVSDPSFRLRENIQKRISRLLKFSGAEKTITSRELTGLSKDELRKYIQSKFEAGMCWDNYGFGGDKWHVGHILPCELFNFLDERQQKICWHFSNLRPEWQTPNIKNLDKLDDGRFASNLSDIQKLEYLRNKGFNI